MARYELTLGPSAIRVILTLPNEELGDLADALQDELGREPKADKEQDLESDKGVYAATLLSNGYFAVHRPMTADELERLRQEQGRRVSRRGFYIFDILSPSAGYLGPPKAAIGSGQLGRLSRAVQNDEEESVVRQLREDELRRILE